MGLEERRVEWTLGYDETVSRHLSSIGGLGWLVVGLVWSTGERRSSKREQKREGRKEASELTFVFLLPFLLSPFASNQRLWNGEGPTAPWKGELSSTHPPFFTNSTQTLLSHTPPSPTQIRRVPPSRRSLPRTSDFNQTPFLSFYLAAF